MILIDNHQTAISIDESQVKRTVQQILQLLEYNDFDIGILFVGDEEMRIYNRDYRNIDKPTDILSFAYHPVMKAGERISPQTDDDKNLGDIVIAPQYVHNDLARWEQSFDERMRTLLVHGICHLLGYDHIEDADYEVMHEQEAWLLDELKNMDTFSQ